MSASDALLSVCVPECGRAIVCVPCGRAIVCVFKCVSCLRCGMLSVYVLIGAPGSLFAQQVYQKSESTKKELWCFRKG